jgi:hypothetical protein
MRKERKKKKQLDILMLRLCRYRAMPALVKLYLVYSTLTLGLKEPFSAATCRYEIQEHCYTHNVKRNAAS